MSLVPARGNEGRLVLGLIAAASLARLVFAWATGLGIDESYMVATGRALRLGYFDHPPASWWMQWAGAALFGTAAPIAVRAPFIAAFALTTWLMYRLGTVLHGPRAGLWAALLLSLSPVFGLTTASWVLPDGPLDLALVAAALCLIHALEGQGWRWWLATGLCAGLGLFAKYSAVLTVAGALLYLLTSPRHRSWLARPQPYVAGLLALAVFSPVVIWNATHGWASFAFQGNRALGLRLRPWLFLVVLAGEALFVLPWIWAPMMLAAGAALRRGRGDWRGWLGLCLAAPPVLGFAAIAVVSRQRVLFHWAAPGYLMLFPLLGAEAARRAARPWLRRLVVATVALELAVMAVMGTQLRLDWLHPAIAAVARHDPDLAGRDWVSLRRQLRARGLLAPGVLVAVPNWSLGGKIAYALGPGLRVICLDPDARQFGFDAPEARFAGRDALVLTPGAAPVGWFARLVTLADATVTFRGRVLLVVHVYRGVGLRARRQD